MRTAVIGVAAGVLLTACTSSHHSTGSSSPVPTTSSSQPSVVAPLLPGVTLSTSPAPWSVPYAATQFKNLLARFSAATAGTVPSSSASFSDYVQYSQRIAVACDPFLNGLREGLWPVNAQLTIVHYMRLQQTVCDVELARGQAANVSEYKGVQPPPAGADEQLLNYRLQIYKLLGI